MSFYTSLSGLQSAQTELSTISHNLANIFHVADRIVVLRLGRRTATFDRRTCTQEQVVAAITGARQDDAVVAELVR